LNYYPTVDIVIPCYNIGHIIEKCVNSVIAQEYKNVVKIYLINDGSTDNTPDVLESFISLNNITVIHHKQNKGLSAARNTGIRAGKGEIICFLDGDMVVKQNWLKYHIEILSNKDIMGVVGDHRLPEGETANSLDKYLYNKRRGARQFGEGTPIKFPYFLFSNTSIKRIVFQMIKFFDEKISSYGGEDTELALRLWEVYPESLRFSSKAVSEHHSQLELDEFCRSMYNYGKTNLPVLLEKHPQYKNDLGGDWIYTSKGFFLFNPIVRWFIGLLNRYFSNYFLTRYMVIDAVIRGARSFTL